MEVNLNYKLSSTVLHNYRYLQTILIKTKCLSLCKKTWNISVEFQTFAPNLFSPNRWQPSPFLTFTCIFRSHVTFMFYLILVSTITNPICTIICLLHRHHDGQACPTARSVEIKYRKQVSHWRPRCQGVGRNVYQGNATHIQPNCTITHFSPHLGRLWLYLLPRELSYRAWL